MLTAGQNAPVRHPVFSQLRLGACIVVAAASANAQSADELLPGGGHGQTPKAPWSLAAGESPAADGATSAEPPSTEVQAEAVTDSNAPVAPQAGTAWRLMLTGALATGAFYGLGYLTAEGWPHHPASPALRLPVVGPWMALTDLGCAGYGGDCGTASTVLQTALVSLSALGQAGGLLLVAEGIYLAVAGDDRPKERGESAVQSKFYGAPVLTSQGAGLMVGGTF